MKCRLAPTPAISQTFQKTCEAFARAEYVALGHSQRLKTSNKVKLHRACYREIRSKFRLSANLAIRAIARVASAVKSASESGKTVSGFHSTSVDYDQRVFDYRERDETVSITTIDGRLHVPLKIGGFQREQLMGKKPTCARLVKCGKDWDIHIVIEAPPPPKQAGPSLGIDLGIRQIATMSSGRRISGRRVQARKSRFARIRASLQSKGTKGAKRVLRRLSGRERRFKAWVNHNVSRSIVREVLQRGYGLVCFENLKGIRKRTRSWNPHINRMISGWSFRELLKFSQYKLARVGIATELVSPFGTSRTCHLCGKEGDRRGPTFSCGACGRIDADLNAAANIARGGVEPREIRGDRNAARIGDLLNFIGSHRSVKSPAR